MLENRTRESSKCDGNGKLQHTQKMKPHPQNPSRSAKRNPGFRKIEPPNRVNVMEIANCIARRKSNPTGKIQVEAQKATPDSAKLNPRILKM
jgi:hypothetical protein